VLCGPEEALFGISDASREKMSGHHNPLIMDGKLTPAFFPWSLKESVQFEIWGKSHMELRADTQFVRFWFTRGEYLLTLNNI
jgi:hypothetical protein